MTRTKSFEEMGREADAATRNFALASAYLSAMTEDQAAELITVSLTRAGWENGSLYLQAALQTVVRARAGELLHAALTIMHDAGQEATENLRQAFERGVPARTDAEPMVPRAESVRRDGVTETTLSTHLPEEEPAEVLDAQAPGQTSAPLTPPESGNQEAPLPGVAQSRQDSLAADPRMTAWNALAREAQELMTWCAANPTARFAKTPSRDTLVRLGYLASNGSGPNATWDLTPQGINILPPSR